MSTECSDVELALQPVGRRPVVAFDAAPITSDGGAVLLREVDRRIDLLGRLAGGFVDHRDPGERSTLGAIVNELGRPADALAVLRVRSAPSVEAQLLTAEIEVALYGPAAADATFQALTGRADADPDWYLAWANVQTSGADAVRVLEQGGERFPRHAGLQERLAVAAWAERAPALASRAADRALAADPSRTGAWFVKIELASTGARRDEDLAPLLDLFPG